MGARNRNLPIRPRVKVACPFASWGAPMRKRHLRRTGRTIVHIHASRSFVASEIAAKLTESMRTALRDIKARREQTALGSQAETVADGRGGVSSIHGSAASKFSDDCARGATRKIEMGRKRVLVTAEPNGGWYIAMSDGRSHVGWTLAADEFAFLFGARGAAPSGEA